MLWPALDQVTKFTLQVINIFFVSVCDQWKDGVSDDQVQQSTTVGLLWEKAQSTLLQKNHAEQRWLSLYIVNTHSLHSIAS